MNTLRICTEAANKINTGKIKEYTYNLIFRDDGKIRNRFPMHRQFSEASAYVNNVFANNLKNGEVKIEPKEFTVNCGSLNLQFTFDTVMGTIKGAGENRKTFIIGAYYDTSQKHPGLWWLNESIPEPIQGADNNASGVAVMLELSRVFGEIDMSQFDFDLQFIAFANKELRFPKNALEIVGTETFVENFIKNEPFYKNKSISAFMLDAVGYNPLADQIECATVKISHPLFGALCKINEEAETGLTLKKGSIPFFIPSRLNALFKFEEAGVDACLFSESMSFKKNKNYPGNPYINTRDDTIDKLNFSMMSKLAKLLAVSFARLQ